MDLQNTPKCENHKQLEANYQYLKTGTTEVFYYCNECNDDFDGDTDFYTIAEISTKNVEELTNQLNGLKKTNSSFQERIKTMIEKRNKEFKLLVEDMKASLIEIIDKSSNNFYENFKNFQDSKFISNYDNYNKQIELLSKALEDHGKNFDNDSYAVRGYVKDNINLIHDFIKVKFDDDREILTSLKIKKDFIQNFVTNMNSEKIIYDIFDKGLTDFIEFLKGCQIDFLFDPLKLISNNQYICQSNLMNLNFYGFYNFEESQLLKIKDPKMNFDFNIIRNISNKIIENQKNYYINQLSRSPGFFLYDNASYPYNNDHIFLILQIVLKRAFGDSYISYDPMSFEEGLIIGHVQLIYGDRSNKNFSFNNCDGIDRNNQKALYSNKFIRIKAKFNSFSRNINQNVYIFKDDYSIFYAHQNPNNFVYFYYNNKNNYEIVSIDQDIRTLLYSNLQTLINSFSNRITILQNTLPVSFINNKIIQRNSILNSRKSITNSSFSSKAKSSKIDSNFDNQTKSKKKNSEISEEIYINDRNPYKMVDNKKLKAILAEEIDIEECREKEKQVFKKILEMIFKDKIAKIIKVKEGRFLGLFMIFNKNKLFEVTHSNEKNFFYGYEVTCSVKINENITETKFYFNKKGLRLIKPLNDFNNQCNNKNYFLNNDKLEAIEKEEIYFPEILNYDLENFLNKDYQSIFTKKYESEEEIENAKLYLIQETFKKNKENICKGKYIAYNCVVEELLKFIKNSRLEKFMISQIKEFNLDLDFIKAKYEDEMINNSYNQTIDHEYNYKTLCDRNLNIKDENIKNQKKKGLLGFELKYTDEVFKSDSSNELNNLVEMKKRFLDKKLNNKVFKIDLIFEIDGVEQFSSILFFLDIIPKISKKNNNNLYYYKYKNDEEINKNNIKVYFLNPLGNFEVFRYKSDGSHKYIFNYASNYFSLQNLLNNGKKKDRINDDQKEILIKLINNKDFIEKIKISNEEKSFEDCLNIKINDNNILETFETKYDKDQKANFITELFFIDSSEVLKLSEEGTSNKLKITGNISYVNVDGHIKEKSMNDEEILEKEIIENIKNENNQDHEKKHFIYLLEKGLYPIREFKDIDRNIEKYDPIIQEVLDKKIIQRCRNLEIKPLFGDENMKMFYVQKLRLILDISGSMNSVLESIRNEMKKLYDEKNMIEYQVTYEGLVESSDESYVYTAIIKSSNEGCIGEAIYFVSDFAIPGTNEEIPRDNLIKHLKSKNQRLYLHSLEKEPTDNFKKVAEETDGWSIVKKLK